MIIRDDRGRDRLAIFERFVRDESLPKFRRPQRDGGISIATNGSFTISNVTGDVMLTSLPARRSFWQRLWRQTPHEPRPAISVREFFAHMHTSVEELQIVEARARGYEQAIKDALDAGQTALVEILRRGLIAARSEAGLVTMGLTKFLSEDTVVKFTKKSPKGLRLDRLALFTRAVPHDLIARKHRADELEIFDNYAVLHYDPDGKHHVEEKRDPIFFGLIEGRRRLYVIGDWIDEQCDLTLDAIADALGEKAIESLVVDETEKLPVVDEAEKK